MKTYLFRSVLWHMFFCSILQATPNLQSPTAVKRVVIAPWSSKESGIHYRSHVLRHVESVLNHLGVYIEYFDIDKEPFPDVSKMRSGERYLGVLSYFIRESIQNSEKLYSWLNHYAESGLPWVILGHVGFLNSVDTSKSKALFNKFGISFTGSNKVPILIRESFARREEMNYERKLTAPLEEWAPFTLNDQENKYHWLKLATNGPQKSASAVFVTPRISVAYGRYALYAGQKLSQLQWQVNPYAFLRAAFSIDALTPVPDVSVLNGNRVFFSHIDGDAFNTLSKIVGGNYCGEIIERDIINSNPTLPFGVSLIVSELIDESAGSKRIFTAARRLMALPNVEPASHTYTHPLKWDKGTSAYGLKESFNPKQETLGSIQYLEKNITDSKPVKLLYWSGDCMPGENTFKLLSEVKALNLNGGDSIYDSQFNSISFLAPLGRPVESYFQVFAGSPSEILYTDGWKEKFFGLREVIQTFSRTGSPTILKPINPYFHFYSAEFNVSLEALKQVMEWAKKQAIAPIFPSQYVQSVLGFRSAKIERISVGHFRISNRGALNTLRIDATEVSRIDLSKSRGVLGYKKLQTSLYLSLNPDGKDVEVVMSIPSALKVPDASPQIPYVESVGGLLKPITPLKGRLAFEIAPFTRSPLILENIQAPIIRTELGKETLTTTVSKGRAQINFDTQVYPQKMEIFF